MKDTKFKIISVLTLVLAILMCGTVSAQNSDLKSVLKAFKVEKKDNKEYLTNADKVSPGDIIEYQLVYTNKTGNVIHSLKPVLPIPFGTELIENTAFPKIEDASISDEKSFKAYPFMKEVTLPNGSKTKMKTNAKEYRYIRWTTDELKNDANAEYRVRVKVVEVKQ